jgi:ATP-dependent DNA helicase RecG
MLISEEPSITTLEIAKTLGLTKRAVLKNIEKLKAENKLKRIGSSRAGHWEIIGETNPKKDK